MGSWYVIVIVLCIWYTSLSNTLCLFLLDCWQHLRNVWFGAVITKLGDHLKYWMEEDLDEIHYSLQITTDVI